MESVSVANDMLEGERGEALVRLVEKNYHRLDDAKRCYQYHAYSFNDLKTPLEKINFSVKTLDEVKGLITEDCSKNLNTLIAYLIPSICFNSIGETDLLTAIKKSVART